MNPYEPPESNLERREPERKPPQEANRAAYQLIGGGGIVMASIFAAYETQRWEALFLALPGLAVAVRGAWSLRNLRRE